MLEFTQSFGSVSFLKTRSGSLSVEGPEAYCEAIRFVTATQAALISTSFSPALRRSSAFGRVAVRTSFNRPLEVFPQVTQIT